MIHGVGINDLHYCLSGNKNTAYEKRVYVLWYSMIHRCYSKPSLERNQCYKDVEVCDEWLLLSNFARDIKNLKGYYLWENNPNQKICLDKDILSNGAKRIYSPETCCFVSIYENVRRKHCLKKRNISNVKLEILNANYNKVIKCTKPDGSISIYKNQTDAEKDGFKKRSVGKCCAGQIKTHFGCKFEYVQKVG